jgi:hypothetical protein
VIVSVAVAGLVPLMLIGLVEPKVKVGGFTALEGAEVMVALSVTDPVKPPAGVSVTVEVLPVDAPADNDTGLPVMVKLGGGRSIV